MCLVQILESLTKSLVLDSSVSLAALAAQTANFSGADLGGLVGTAHLASVHESIDAPEDESSEGSSAREAEVGEVIRLGGKKNSGGLGRSRAEEMALKKRVGVMLRHGKASSSSAVREKETTSKESPAVSLTPLSPSPVLADPSLPLQLAITAAHLASALTSARPSVPEAERRRLARIYAQFVDERSPEGLPGGDGGGDAVGSRVSLG